MRVAAMKFPFITLKSDKNAASKIKRPIAGEPKARANASSVPKWLETNSRQGYTNDTAPTTRT